MEAIVLAGGLGTRLRSVVGDVPKPMAPVHGRPFLAYVLDQLYDAGFARAVLAVGYRNEVIRAHFGDRHRGLALDYSVETTPLGTGGALRLAWGTVAARNVFVVNGDTLVEIDYVGMRAAHVAADAELSMAICEVADAGRYGAVDLADGVVHGFREKGSAGAGMINAGVYIAGARLRSRFPSEAAFSFEHDVLMPHVASLRPRAFRAAGRFIDIGVPEDYARAPAVLGTRMPT